MKLGGLNEKNFFPMDSLYSTYCVVSAAQRFLALGQPESGTGSVKSFAFLSGMM